VTLASPFPPEECIQRLRNAADDDAPVRVRLTFRPRMLLRVDGDRIRVLYQRPWSRNSFAPLYWAHLCPFGAGTMIPGRFGIHPAVRVFMVVTGFLIEVLEARAVKGHAGR
jgi:hypothetical protein